MFSQEQFNQWMADKYKNIGINAQANMLRAQAAAKLDTERAAGEHQLNSLLGSNSPLGALLSNRAVNAPGGFTGFAPGPTPVPIDPSTGRVEDGSEMNDPGFRTGTAKVPGQGDGTVDTVNAKLAPGEAVLNKAAAEHLGRGFIDALNAIGALKMGMTPAKGGKQPTEDDRAKPAPAAKAPPSDTMDNRAQPVAQHFAKGTSNVQPKGGKGGKGQAPSLTPAMLAMVMQSLHGGAQPGGIMTAPPQAQKLGML